MRRVPKTTLCSILVMNLVLSACGGSDEAGDGSDGGSDPVSAGTHSITPPDSDDDIVPCLAGTWILDNARFLDTIMSFGGMPAGFSVDLVGPYYVRFDRSSSGNAWRNDWKMITSGSAEGMNVNMTVTWDSIETFEYSADGERFEAWNSVIVDHRTTMDAGGLPIGAMATPDASTVSAFGFQYTTGTESDGPQSAGGSYTCSDQRLEISLDMAPSTPLVLDRTQDIPEPPLVLPEA